ncbi:MAG TPA: methylmalonyl-CoA epimerase [Chloroflexota bacterium]
MVRRLDHVAILVPNLAAAAAKYRRLLGIELRGIEDQPEFDVRVGFLDVGGVRLELVQPNADTGSLAEFLRKRGGGLHHLAFVVDDLEAELARLRAEGARLVDQEPRPGAHGSRVAFVHPKDLDGVLVELVQPAGDAGGA